VYRLKKVTSNKQAFMLKINIPDSVGQFWYILLSAALVSGAILTKK